jgi:hypothetical protein
MSSPDSTGRDSTARDSGDADAGSTDRPSRRAAGPRTTGRGNPAPRRALSRFSPTAADAGATTSSAVPDPVDRGEPSAAAAPGGTGGRDLLIPGRASSTGRAKNGRPVPSLAELMPPTAPAGRRSGGHHGHHRGGAAGASGVDVKGDTAKKSDGKDTKDGKDARNGKDAKTVEIAVRLPKPVRKRLKARADELGLTPEQTVARLVEVWLEE